MLIFIIFISVWVLSIIYIIISVNEKVPSKADDILAPISLFTLILMTFAAVITGSVALSINSFSHCKMVNEELSEKETSLKLQNLALSKMEDSYLKYALIVDYNKSVKEYKAELIEAQKNLANPFVNWYTCSEYGKFDPENVYYYKIYANEWTKEGE